MPRMKRFALLGAAGFVAPRHMQAIAATGNKLVLAHDPHDSVGVLDRTAPDCSFTTDESEFWRQASIMSRNLELDFLSICTPNASHVRQVEMGLEAGLDVICEKPLGLSMRQVEPLVTHPRESKVWTILQLRLHESVVALKRAVESSGNHVWRVNLVYVTPRGPWYDASWKGCNNLSGGIVLNIGIHLFDLLTWVFGAPIKHYSLIQGHSARGYLQLERAHVDWFLSTDRRDLPSGQSGPHRSLTADELSVDFSRGFDDLHTKSYEMILDGRGFGIEDVLPSIELVDVICADARRS